MAKKTLTTAVTVAKKKVPAVVPDKAALSKAAKATQTKALKSRTKAIAAGIDVSAMEADAAATAKREPTQKDLEAVGAAAKVLQALYARQAKGQLVMDQIAKDIYAIEVEQLPQLLEAAGLQTITLKDGSVIVCNTEYYPNIKKEEEQAAFKWLRSHNFAELIKTKVEVAFGKGQDKQALMVMEFLKKKKVLFAAKEGVHGGTLKAFVKEQMENGVSLPPSISVHTVSRAVLKAPKQ